MEFEGALARDERKRDFGFAQLHAQMGEPEVTIDERKDLLGIKKLDVGANGGRVIFRPQPNVEPLTIIKLIQAQPKVFALDGQDKLKFKLPLEGGAERLRAANALLVSLGARKAA